MADPRNIGASFSKEREVQGGMLAYYAEAATPAFWARYWQGEVSERTYEEPEKRETAELAELLSSALPHGGRVLEGGCGAGRVVCALRRRGVECEGVEWSADIVADIRAVKPELPVRQGDVLALDVPDDYYAAYVSLGVIEHRREGPEPFLAEAYRVIRPGGILVVSVPCYNPLRRLKALCGLMRRRNRALPFFQYAMTPEVLRMHVRRAGFRVLRTCWLGADRCLMEEMNWVRRLYRVRGLGWRLRRWVRESAAAGRNLGHMVFVQARKGCHPQMAPADGGRR